MTTDLVPGRDEAGGEAGGEAARRYGRAWYVDGRSALLIVPSVVARTERNVVINARHPDFERLTVDRETAVWWDRRLFQRQSG